MGSRIECFWVEPAPFAEESFRRYVSYNPDSKCAVDYYHDATVVIAEKVPWLDKDSTGSGETPTTILKTDPRWPVYCGCGYLFSQEDHWQHNFRQLYQRQDTGELLPLARMPAGAMWDADWHRETLKGPDGRCLVVRTPGGDWMVDAKSRSGGGWTRTGEVPKVTANPSILIGSPKEGEPDKYHGWLRDGWLIEC
jgi:hypothetical protein